MRKNVKQILVLERERVGGGDGFLNAELTLARARGEIIEPGGKKKKTGVKLPKGYNLMRGHRKAALSALSGTSTPATEGLESGQSTPMVLDEEDEDEEGKSNGAKANVPPGKEVFTCESACGVLAAVEARMERSIHMAEWERGLD